MFLLTCPINCAIIKTIFIRAPGKLTEGMKMARKGFNTNDRSDHESVGKSQASPIFRNLRNGVRCCGFDNELYRQAVPV